MTDRSAGPTLRGLGSVAAASSTLGHVIASVLLLAVMGMTVADVLLRATGWGSINGSVELTEISMVAIVYLALSHAERHDEHVAVDLLYMRLPARAQRVLVVFARLVALITILFLAWRLLAYSHVLREGGHTTGVLRLDLAPVAWVAAAGAVLFALTVLVRLVEVFPRPREKSPDGS